MLHLLIEEIEQELGGHLFVKFLPASTVSQVTQVLECHYCIAAHYLTITSACQIADVFQYLLAVYELLEVESEVVNDLQCHALHLLCQLLNLWLVLTILVESKQELLRDPVVKCYFALIKLLSDDLFLGEFRPPKRPKQVESCKLPWRKLSSRTDEFF